MLDTAGRPSAAGEREREKEGRCAGEIQERNGLFNLGGVLGFDVFLGWAVVYITEYRNRETIHDMHQGACSISPTVNLSSNYLSLEPHALAPAAKWPRRHGKNGPLVS